MESLKDTLNLFLFDCGIPRRLCVEGFWFTAELSQHLIN